MRKIKLLLVAVFALMGVGMASAALPTTGDVGYLYNTDAKKFLNDKISADITGILFKVRNETDGSYKSGNKFKTDAVKEFTDATYNYLRFEQNSKSGTWIRVESSSMAMGNGYHKFAATETESGLLIRCIYQPSQVGYAVQGAYLAFDQNGTLVLSETESYWRFVDQETHDALVIENAIPAKGAIGYLYNPASGKFLGTDGKLSATKGQQLKIVQESKDEKGNPAADFATRAEELAGAKYLRFQQSEGGSGYWAFQNNPMNFSGGYKQFIVRGTLKGSILITHPYPNSSGPGWITAGTYVQVVEDELSVTTLDETNEGAYWQFIDQATYEELTFNEGDLTKAALAEMNDGAGPKAGDELLAILFPNAGFDESKNADGWTVTTNGGNNPSYKTVNGNTGMTKYQGTIRMEKTIKGLPAGWYVLKAQAFGRKGDVASNLPKFQAGEVLETPGVIFANGVTEQVPNAFDGLIDESEERQFKTSSTANRFDLVSPSVSYFAQVPVNGVNKYLLDNSNSGTYAFSLGKYETELAVYVAEGEDLTFGFEKTTADNGDYCGCDNFRLIYAGASDTQYPEGTYYLYNQKTGNFLSRGANWGTRATVATLGQPITVEKTETGIRLRYFDWTSKALGTNLYSDNGNSAEWMDLTVTQTANGVKIHDGVSYMYDEEGILMMGPTEDEWTFVSPFDYEKLIKKTVVDGKAKAMKDAGVADAATLAEYAEKDVTETALAGATLDKNGKDGWEWSAYPINGRGGSVGAGADIFEVYQGAGTLTKKIEGLKPGLYKFTVNAFYRDGWNGDCVNRANAGYVMSTATLNANGNFVRIADWASDRAQGGNPNSMGEAATLFNAGKYVNEVYTCVGEDGVLNLALDQPNFIDGGWFIFGNAKLTYYTDAISEEEVAELIAQIPTDPMNADIKSDLADAKTALEAAPIIKNYKALTALIKEANTSVEQYAATKAALDAYGEKAAQLDKDGKAAYDVADIEKAYTEGTATANLSADVYAAYIKAVKSQTSVGADMTGAIVNPGFQDEPAGNGWTMVASNQNLRGGGAEGNFCGESYHSVFTLSQTLTGMPAGTYSLTAQCYYRIDDNSIDDVPFIFGNDDIALFPQMGNLPDHDGNGWQSMGDAAVEFINGNYYLEIPVVFVVGDDGKIELGAKVETSTHLWCIWDNFTLKYEGTRTVDDVKKEAAIPAYLKALADAKAILPETMDAVTLVNLNNTIKNYAESEVLTDDATYLSVVVATATLKNATEAAYVSVHNAQAIMSLYELMEKNNVVTPEAYETYYAKFEEYNKKYEAGTLTETVENPYDLRAVRTDVTFDDYLLSAWTQDGVQCTNYDQTFCINSWSTEGNADGTEFKVPFFEYWTWDGNSLGATELAGTVANLPAGKYEVEAWVRVRPKNGTFHDDATGITLQVNDDDPIDVTDGESIGQFKLAEYATETIVEDGTLQVKFNVLDGNNISWLAFQNVKYTLLEDFTTAISEVGNKAAAKSIFNVAGQQMNGLQKGLNIVDGKKVYLK